DLAYMHLIEPVSSSFEFLPNYLKKVTPVFRKIYPGTLITSAGFDFESAEQALLNNDADLVAFGKNFISNPDLVERYLKNAKLTPFDVSTFYGGGAEGYTDYPFI
ncbi:MAG: alkene reductase, partial [Ignavibacteria bacterium]|nr:alkene reductase [Ignavibacteria bacterium]